MPTSMMSSQSRARTVATLLAIALPSLATAQEAPATPWPTAIVSWSPDPEPPVFEGTGSDTWDRMIRERGWIVKDRTGRLHLFYTGYNDALSPLRRLGHATSPDGIHWERDPANPLVTDSWVEDMSVMPDPSGNGYIMVAEGEGDIAHRLTSPDLVHWTLRGPLDIRKANGDPIAPGPRGTPFLMMVDQVWNLFYERGDLGVWLARSPDGKVFTNVSDDPVLARTPGTYDAEAVAVNQVVRYDGLYYAFYHANDRRPWADWTTCVARSADLVHWEKHPGNPIIRNNCSSAILVEESDGSSHLYTMHPSIRRYSNPKPQR
jgi:hypothetical protein